MNLTAIKMFMMRNLIVKSFYLITLNIVHTRWLLLMRRMLLSQILLVEAYLAVIKVTENTTVLLCFLFSNLGEMAKI